VANLIDLTELAELPALVRALQARVAELERQRSKAVVEELVDAEEAARILDMTPGAVRAAARRGALRSVHIGKRVRFKKSELAR
jgi:excisionase family DNA binding protein